MKTILAPLTFAAALALPLTARAQKAGDAVTPEALQKLEWIQGEAPKEWEPGKLYILECWATWCGPCIANIPHVDALYDKFKDQGLRVIGVDVWEDGKDKVTDFVKKKGDGMSYPVAYTGKGGVFETEWLKPADVRGIPHAFVVKDGKVILASHPAALTEEIVESLLKGGDGEKAILDKMNADNAKQNAIMKARSAWQAAYAKKDAAAMRAAADELETVSPGDMYVPLFRNEILVASKDWSGLEKAVEALDDSNKMRPLILGSLANTLGRTDDVPVDTLHKVAAAYEAQQASGKKTPVEMMNLARLHWKAGDKDKALAAAKETADLAKAGASPVKIPTAPFERFASAVEAGNMPSAEEFAGWMKEAQTAAKAPEATH